MNFDSPLAWKRRRLTNIDRFDPMDVEAARAKLEAAKEKYGREIRVFETTMTSQSPPPEAANTEETDECLEFTAEDYYRLLATKKEDKYLKTRKLREAETAARRSRITKAVIRIRFLDGHTLETIFHPSEPLQSIFDLLKKVLARPELPHYLYTTPPKKQIKDTNQDFFAAGFVPGAIVHFTYDLPKEDAANAGPFLQEDVVSLKGLDLVPEPVKEVTESTSETAIVNDRPVVPERKPADKKAVKPKWLKM
ncbi:plant UBX domain-containing protein 1 isoform X1 [Beta vulgaris subsp. vulgaris]|uniref:plant UBX domain-containing protein 1 isoform X1 n=2 Tax=Beta vulgaris subsp. vulgaris TaxID=3555 RepID=UPI002036FD2D|nr:plant UBX domain-containing protein 1 isoform X1 [Beta vulgaris subsp. vulgaris]XP_048499897.1 plant UBX domain-containing protein 1 isoform X1 [Beta vulgaris subsp. vulgaris]